MRTERGLTVIELMVAIAVAVTLASLAIVPMTAFVERQASAAAINRLIAAVHFGRHAAITLRTRVVVCPPRETPAAAFNCGGHDDWHRGQIVFADRDNNAALDTGDDVLRVISALPAGSTVVWRSFRNRPYLMFEPSGFTAWQNGSLLYCPASGDARDARGVVLNPQGRLRQMVDRNGDGIVEDAKGRPVTCTAAR